MGQPKISKRHERIIVEMLRVWPLKKKVAWEAVRQELQRKLKVERVWSRQSLTANEAIHAAFEAAKNRPKLEGSAVPKQSRSWYAKRVAELEGIVAGLSTKLEALRLRHIQVTYNASLTPGGTQHLFDPLPDNTRARREEALDD